MPVELPVVAIVGPVQQVLLPRLIEQPHSFVKFGLLGVEFASAGEQPAAPGQCARNQWPQRGFGTDPAPSLALLAVGCKRHATSLMSRHRGQQWQI